MIYAKLENNREINAEELSSGILRSNNYYCIYCGKKVSYVTGSDRSRSHFRHDRDKSCISTFNKQDIDEQSEVRYNNNKSEFYKWWQSLFLNSQIEYKFENHIADIYLENPTQIYLDNKSSIINNKKLVIEIQHSNITKFDSKNRESFYRKDDRELLWIFNISHIPHIIEHIITLLNSI